MITNTNMPVLVLNKNYEPLDVITAREAIGDIFSGKSQALDQDYSLHDYGSWKEFSEFKKNYEEETSNKWINLVHYSILVPSIVRLTKFDKVRKPRTKFSRINVYIRDNFTCQYCGFRGSHETLNLDHVIPSSRGGKTNWENIVCSCIPCNTKKAARTPQECGLKLLRQPKVFSVPTKFIKHYREEWKPFLKFDDVVSMMYWNVEMIDD